MKITDDMVARAEAAWGQACGGLLPDERPMRAALEAALEATPKSGKRQPALGTVRAALERVLTPGKAEAVIDHRQRKKAPLTLLAAELLAIEFEKTQQPEAAADMMILRGWQAFKLSWWVNEQQRERAGGPGNSGSAVGARREELRERLENGYGSGREGSGDPRYAGLLPSPDNRR